MYQRQVSFQEAISMAFNQYCKFTGRASRSEYWWFALFTFILGAVVLGVVGGIFGAQSTVYTCISCIINLALLLPSLGLCVRRLHDIGKGGGWIFINFVPLIGWIIFLVWMVKDSEPGNNRFGPMPNLVA